jgi:hypothetical protein
MKFKLMLVFLVSTLSGCATIDQGGGCSETAFDSCMTIEQADRVKVRGAERQSSKGKLSQDLNAIETKSLAGSQMVITPWVDESGQAHSGEVLNFTSKGAS